MCQYDLCLDWLDLSYDHLECFRPQMRQEGDIGLILTRLTQNLCFQSRVQRLLNLLHAGTLINHLAH